MYSHNFETKPNKAIQKKEKLTYKYGALTYNLGHGLP